MESSGETSSTHLESEVSLLAKIKHFIHPLKLVALFLCLLIGIAAVGLFGGVYWLLHDLDYFALTDQLTIIGFICAGFAALNIVLTLIFRKSDYIFVMFSFFTTIFGSFQFIVFAVSPFAKYFLMYFFDHYQYKLSFSLSLILLTLTYLYVFKSRKKKQRTA
jgi:hypothetical protein